MTDQQKREQMALALTEDERKELPQLLSKCPREEISPGVIEAKVSQRLKQLLQKMGAPVGMTSRQVLEFIAAGAARVEPRNWN